MVAHRFLAGAGAAVLLLLAPLPGSAPAPAQGVFSPTEQVYIIRNELLDDLARDDPASARRILDLMAAVRAGDAARPEGARRRRMPDDDGDLERRVFDPVRNPDLLIFQRASPEAAHELFQIIKRAGSGKPGR
jgi:hypothetical protein